MMRKMWAVLRGVAQAVTRDPLIDAKSLRWRIALLEDQVDALREDVRTLGEEARAVQESDPEVLEDWIQRCTVCGQPRPR